MTSTKEWAKSHGLCVDDDVPPASDDCEPYKRTSEEVAIRTIILHCVAAVGYEVDPRPVIEWLQDQSIWNNVSSREQAFLSSESPSDKERNAAKWRQEAQWALLWAIGKIDSLGLPTRTCDTGKLVGEIMPALGNPIDSFISSAKLRSSAELCGEDDRVYNLHCYARQSFGSEDWPDDLVYDVLFQRHYAFEWLNGDVGWDSVRTDT